MIGQSISHYRIAAMIGAGGMGEVYRATDTKLGRDVAIKIIREFTQEAQHIARFQREAQVLASLNHPNIASIYGLEESAGVRALVMELVEGPTLGERIAQGAIPVEEALPIAKQIARLPRPELLLARSVRRAWAPPPAPTPAPGRLRFLPGRRWKQYWDGSERPEPAPPAGNARCAGP